MCMMVPDSRLRRVSMSDKFGFFRTSARIEFLSSTVNFEFNHAFFTLLIFFFFKFIFKGSCYCFCIHNLVLIEER